MTSGTNNRNIYNGILTMMDDLQERGRLDDLKAIQLKHISPLEAYNKWKDGKLVGIGSVALVKDLDKAMTEWVENYRCAETTRVGYKFNVRHLVKTAKRKATVADLPDTLRKYRAHCISRDTLRQFNHARVTSLAFARDQYGKNSELWRLISDIDMVDYRKNRMNNPLTVKEVVDLTSQMKPEFAEMVWTMCTTGMGFKEYLDGFTVKSEHIIIHGEKNDNRHNRVVPIIRTPAPRVLQYKRFREVIQVVRKDVTPYDFRRTYAVWLEEAGILKSHRDAYMGHTANRMSDLYLVQDVTKYLKQDAKLMKDYIEKKQKAK